MSLIIDRNACNIYKSEIFDVIKQDPIKVFPKELVLEIFSFLNLDSLSVSRKLSKQWSQLASTPILWQTVIYQEIAFNSKNWVQWDSNLVKDIDIQQEMTKDVLPESTDKYSDQQKSMINKLAKTNEDSYQRSNILEAQPGILVEHIRSGWLMTIDLSKSINYIHQKSAKSDYQIPTVLEAITCILAEYSRSKKRLFSKKTRCKEFIQGKQAVIGDFMLNGFVVNLSNYSNDKIGIAAIQRF